MVWRRGQTYGQDLRERVLAAGGFTARQAAARFAVSVSYVVKARQRLTRTGSTAPRPQRPPVARKLVAYHAVLRARVDEAADATLAEHREWLAETHGVLAGLTTIWRTLRALRLTRGKSCSGRPSRPVPMSPGRGRTGSPGSLGWT